MPFVDEETKHRQPVQRYWIRVPIMLLSIDGALGKSIPLETEPRPPDLLPIPRVTHE